MKKSCFIKRLILFVITLPVAFVFSIWAGYMLGNLLSFPNFELIPYENSNPVEINWYGVIATYLFYFYVLIFKSKTKHNLRV